LRHISRRRFAIAIRASAVAAAALLAGNCGDKSPSAPTASPTPTPSVSPTPPPPAASIDWTVTGRIVATLTSQPVPGAQIQVTGGATFTATTTGDFTVTGSGTAAVDTQVSVSAPGYVTRRTYIRAGSNRSGVEIDIIRDAAPFQMTMYRELVRQTLDGNGSPALTRRWQQDPSFYIVTVDETGATVPQSFIDTTAAVIPDIVADATGNRFHPANIEAGTSTAPPAAGTIMVTFPSAYFNAAGQASGIGVSPCTIKVWQGDVPAAVPRVIAHEIGHCLGLSHITVTGLPPTAQGLMGKFGPGSWTLPRLTDAEKHHAAILYARPVGNGDPDVDPTFFFFSRTDMVSAPISCFLK